MTLTRTMTQLRMLHAALMASLVVYGVVAVMAAPTWDRTASTAEAPVEGAAAVAAADPGVYLVVLGGLAAVVLFVVIPFLRARLLPPREAFPQPLAGDLEPDAPEAAAINRLRTASIITWALCESVSLFGLAAAFLFHRALYYAPFAAVAAMAMIWYAPRRAALDEVVRGARGDHR